MARNSGNYRNPCLTMHQPWASLLVYGIKRIEGRSWPAPIRGRLWIHAAGKVPEPETIKAMEEFYREIYAVNGITDLKFPEHYPVSRLLGCVEVVGCLKREELVSWNEIPEGVRLEGLNDFCWLCENPQKLVIPFEMRGFQGVYNLERKVYEAVVRGLTSVTPPLPVKFLLPDPRDPFSLKPGSISSPAKTQTSSKTDKSESLTAAIAGARAAATQFSKINISQPAREPKPNPSSNHSGPTRDWKPNSSSNQSGPATQLSKSNSSQPAIEPKPNPSSNHSGPTRDWKPNSSSNHSGPARDWKQFPSSNRFVPANQWRSISSSNRSGPTREWKPVSSGTRSKSKEANESETTSGFNEA